MQRALLALLLFLCLSPALYADAVLKDREASMSYLFPIAVSVRTEVAGQVAVTTTRQTFRNTTGKPIKLQYGFPLGLRASVTDFTWYQHGTLRTAKLSGKPQDSVSGGPGGTPDIAFQEFLGKSPFVFSFVDSLAADSVLVVDLTYMELLQYTQGKVEYSYPLRQFLTEQFAFDFQFSLSSGRKIESIEALSHTIEFAHTEHSAEGSYIGETEPVNGNLVLRYRLSQQDLGAFMLSHKPNGDDGYFIMLAEPDPDTSPDKVIQKIFTFIIDVSGSMAGVKMDQAREAALYCIDHLNPKDKFNIIAFSSNIRKFALQPVAATPENIDSGLDYIRSLTAGGGTNLQDAVIQGLLQDMADTTSNVIVFLTDGQAALDQQTVVNANTKNVRIFVFGIGTDVDQNLLQQLAANNNGLSEFLGTNNVETSIGGFYNKIRNPLLLSPTVAFSAGEVYETYPLKLPDIYVGEQLVMLGRYRQPGPAQATLAGKSAEQVVEYTYDVEFTGDSLINVFLPKMWAKQKIDALLVLMSGVAENSNQWKEWKAEIIRLSLLYGIVSPFSSFSDPGQTTAVAEFGDADVLQSMVQCSPNPSSGRVRIALDAAVFTGSEPTVVSIRDMWGREIYRIALLPGVRSLVWDGNDTHGTPVPNGMYIVSFLVDGVSYSQKVMIAQ